MMRRVAFALLLAACGADSPLTNDADTSPVDMACPGDGGPLCCFVTDAHTRADAEAACFTAGRSSLATVPQNADGTFSCCWFRP